VAKGVSLSKDIYVQIAEAIAGQIANIIEESAFINAMLLIGSQKRTFGNFYGRQ